VEGCHDRPTSPQSRRADDRDQRLVDMEDVQIGGSFADLSPDAEAKGQGHDRTVGPDRSNASDLGDPIGVIGDCSGSWSDDCDSLTGGGQQLSDSDHLLLDSPVPSKVVGTDQTDPHGRSRSDGQFG
jgi:hypothetical protein